MLRKCMGLSLALALVLGLVGTPAQAGGTLESVDITGLDPSPIPGHVIAQLVGIRWDARCIPVSYSLNDTLDPIPNPAGAAFLSLADASAAMQRGFDSWNDIRTSFIDMNIDTTTSNPGFAGFDMVNELTFRPPPGFGAIAVSPSVTLIADSSLPDGTDIDGDGDSDVSSAITVCGDVDGDGDFELPAGNYPAGTILDNDVTYNTTLFRFTTADADIDNVTLSVDLEAIAVHEFGHSHGLSHVLENQLSIFDGTSTTMYPFVDTGDPDSELSQRTVGSDDVATSSFFYPEGSDTSGPAALQPGDLDFDWVYSTISGSVEHGVLGGPVTGASVSAVNLFTGRTTAAAFSGTVQLSYDLATGGLFLVSPAFNVVNGDYTIPVPLGLYALQMEAIDGNPVPTSSVSIASQLGTIFGQLNFNEEFYNGQKEAAIEKSPASLNPLFAFPSFSYTGKDFVTNDQSAVANFGGLTNVGFTGVPDGTLYAVRIPTAELAALDTGSKLYVQSADFFTFISDSSVVPTYGRAMLTTGQANGATATIDLDNPLRKAPIFFGQDRDFTPLYFANANGLGNHILNGIANGTIQDLFLVLEHPDAPHPGFNGFNPLIGLSATPPLSLNSYLSVDGGATWNQRTDFDFMFRLTVTAD